MARRDAQSISAGVVAVERRTGKVADIDILKYLNQNSDCVAIECKGKELGGRLSLEEAQDWKRRLPTFLAHVKASSREVKVSFELWAYGKIAGDPPIYLPNEQSKRTKHPIAWRAGQDVLNLVTSGREKGIADALKQHFLRHPWSRVVPDVSLVSSQAPMTVRNSNLIDAGAS